MTRRFTISGLDHLIRLLHTHPAFMSLNTFAGIKVIAEEAKRAAKSCSCNVGKVYQAHAKDFELALQNMGGGDHLIIKQVLQVDQLCYYTKKSTGGLQLNCI